MWWYNLLTMPTPRIANCTLCGVTVTLTDKKKIDAWRASGRTYCSPEHRDEWVRQDRSARMARTNRKHASKRMKERNPMTRPETREKMRRTLKEMGHKPAVPGGWGRPAPEPQRKLAAFLGWPMEQTIVLGDGERPYSYSGDIVHPGMKVCVEVDGKSHSGQAHQASDRRRDERLSAAGWLTFRFSNQDAMERTADCAQTVLSTTSKWEARIPI